MIIWTKGEKTHTIKINQIPVLVKNHNQNTQVCDSVILKCKPPQNSTMNVRKRMTYERYAKYWYDLPLVGLRGYVAYIPPAGLRLPYCEAICVGYGPVGRVDDCRTGWTWAGKGCVVYCTCLGLWWAGGGATVGENGVYWLIAVGMAAIWGCWWAGSR